MHDNIRKCKDRCIISNNIQTALIFTYIMAKACTYSWTLERTHTQRRLALHTGGKDAPRKVEGWGE